MTSLIEKVARAIYYANSREERGVPGNFIEHKGRAEKEARAAIQVVLREMMGEEVNKMATDYSFKDIIRIEMRKEIQSFAKHHHIDLSESKP